VFYSQLSSLCTRRSQHLASQRLKLSCLFISLVRMGRISPFCAGSRVGHRFSLRLSSIQAPSFVLPFAESLPVRQTLRADRFLPPSLHFPRSSFLSVVDLQCSLHLSAGIFGLQCVAVPESLQLYSLHFFLFCSLHKLPVLWVPTVY
jgi:hypothetical protein